MWLLPLSWGTKGHKCCKGQKTIVTEVQCWFLQRWWLSPLWWPSVWCVRQKGSGEQETAWHAFAILHAGSNGNNMDPQYHRTPWYIFCFYSSKLTEHGHFLSFKRKVKSHVGTESFDVFIWTTWQTATSSFESISCITKWKTAVLYGIVYWGYNYSRIFTFEIIIRMYLCKMNLILKTPNFENDWCTGAFGKGVNTI